MADDAYQRFRSLKLLGDRYVKQGEYMKAAETYEKAMTAWHAPGHPKYEAAADCLRKAMLHISVPHTAKVAQDAGQTKSLSTTSKPKGSTTLLWEDGVFRPVSVSSRVYTTLVVPKDDRKDWITRAFLNQVEGDGRLKTMMESNSSVYVDLSYEYVPHSGPEFFHICMEKAGVWIESLLQESTAKWFTNFVNEGVFRPPHSSDDEKVAVFTAVFGSEELAQGRTTFKQQMTKNRQKTLIHPPEQPQQPEQQPTIGPSAQSRKRWWQFWKTY